jgi:hypothetical protein
VRRRGPEATNKSTRQNNATTERTTEWNEEKTRESRDDEYYNKHRNEQHKWMRGDRNCLPLSFECIHERKWREKNWTKQNKRQKTKQSKAKNQENQ